ncbi:hypothetical protein [Streptomyces sediminimaris]|uniref:hypothetical protein n=1 Tax=Streptomyces sediminimaris TaxID=3383721 RepID=UPI00399AF2D1
MIRYVRHELMAAVALLTAAAAGAAVGVRVVGGASVRAGTVAWVAVAALAFLALSARLRSSRLKWVGDVREFEAAVPLPGGRPAGRDHTLRKALRFSLFLLPSVAIGLLGLPSVLLVALALSLDWLAKAAVGARWERRNGRRLWLGHDPADPNRLSYCPVTRPPSTRTATDAPAG